ncbi:MAG: Crp/Fnr family transcriptional regulator [Candidatus Eremiobacteraeota bacterium]|nr:Crp/Fnr family transcriptional regulator [Candidatus Eremiobacteraeota bacterium]
MNVVDELAGSALFVGAPALASTYAGCFARCRYERRASICAQGDETRLVHLLVRGVVRLTRLVDDGHEMTVAVLGAGDMIGEDALFGVSARDLNAIAIDDCETLAGRGDEVAALAERHPLLAINIARYLHDRRSEAETLLDAISTGTVESRLLGVLRRLADRYGTDSIGGKRIQLRLTHAEIATFVNSTRETITAELAALDRKGIIKRHHRAITLCASAT